MTVKLRDQNLTKDIILRAKKNDNKAWEKILGRAYFLTMSNLRGNTRLDYEDVAMNVVAGFYENINKIDINQNPDAYLKRIVKYKSIDAIRERKKNLGTFEYEEDVSWAATLENSGQQIEQLYDVNNIKRKIFNSLDGTVKNAIVLHIETGLSLRKSVKEVGANYHKANYQLRLLRERVPELLK